MAAGDRNRQQEPEVNEVELGERRETFLENLTSEVQGNLVASGQEFYEFVQPQGSPNQKYQSLNVLSGQRSPDFSSRQVIAQRALSLLDPINKYYSMGSDRNLADKVTFTPLESNDAYANRRLTPEAPTSVNVNFSIPGYVRDGSRTVILGLNQGDKDDIIAARAGRVRRHVAANPGEERYRGYVFPAEFPNSTIGDRPFNFFNEINNLASAGFPEIFETFAEVEDFFPRGVALENGSRTKTIGGDPRVIRTQRGTERLWQPSPRMNRILRVLDYDDFDEFLEDHTMFTPEGVGNPYYSNEHIPDNQRLSPYNRYNNSLIAVLERIRSEYGISKALEAANAALTRQERIILAEQAEPVVYEFYDFETRTSFVRDPFTAVLDEVPSTRTQLSREANVAQPARIEGVYNYGLPGYENSIANSAIPESALPNLYVYQLAVGANPIENLSGQGWDSSPEGDEVRRGYDGLVRLNEFITGTLPRLRAQQAADEDRGISDYLIQYGRATRNTNVVIDLTSSIARRFYNQTTDATSMNLFEEFNEYKNEFPLYTEISIPMLEQGSLNQFLNRTLGATSMVNSIINPEIASSSVGFRFTTYGAIAPQGVSRLGPDQFDSRERTVSIVQSRQQTRVFDFSDWLRNTAQSLRSDNVSELSLNGPWRERNGGQAAVNAWTSQINNLVRRQSRQKAVKYKELLEGRKTLSESETIVYKLVKYATRANRHEPQRRRVLQNYYFANTNEIDLLRFVDTQVKSNKYYQYELYAYDVVYGSKFLFRTRFASFPGARDQLIARQRGSNEGGTLGFYSFNVDTQPNVKVIEYPLIIGGWKTTDDGSGRRFIERFAAASMAGRPDTFVGGVAYPIVKIIPYPPLTPEASIFSYQNTSNKILINLSPSVGEYVGANALNYIAFDQQEREVLQELESNQRIQDPSQPANRISYKESRRAPEMLIYRTDEINTNVAKPEDLYRSFSGKLLKRLNINASAGAEDFARAYDFVDDIQPNRKYYYTFRAAAGQFFSNPGPIYEVELRLSEGFYTPIVKEYTPEVTTTKMPSKKMKRFIEIKGADIQTLPFAEVSQNSGFSNSRTGLFASEKSLVPQIGDNGITGNQFVVRITSRDTGRKVDIVLNFTSTENR